MSLGTTVKAASALRQYLHWDSQSVSASGIVLECTRVEKSFGGVKAVNRFDIQVTKGSVHGLIGPNGAGKSTALNLVSGLIPPTAGQIRYEGRSLRGSMGGRARNGIVRTFQKGRLFSTLSARDNVASAFGPHQGRRLLTWIASPINKGADEKRVEVLVDELLELVGIHDLGPEPVSQLPFGQRRLVEFARAVAARPQVLLLDEPAAGLNTVERQRLIRLIRLLQTDFGITVVLVEHDVGLVVELSDRITVMHQGETIATGDPQQIVADPAVRAAYLGDEAVDDA